MYEPCCSALAPFSTCLRPRLQSQFTRELREFNMYEDCPVFDGLFEYCQVSAPLLRNALCLTAMTCHRTLGPL